MDLDDLDSLSHAPARVSRFAPKSSKPLPRPKSSTLDSAATVVSPKTEETENQAMKSEAREMEAAKKKEEGGDSTPPKFGNSTENGVVKTEAGVTDPKDEPCEELGSMDVDDIEDTVVREIDVFFNPRIDEETQLYLFQYPLRPCWRPYELDERCDEVRVKPGKSEVEIDLSVDVDSVNYDQECGSKMKMTKQTLHCAWKEPPLTGCAVGVLMGNKLHLNPIHTAVQLRPSMKHITSSGSKRKNSATEDAKDSVTLEEPSTVKVASSSKKQKKAGNSVELKKEEVEWVPLKYQASETELSSKIFRRMETQESSPIQFTMSTYDYLNSLCPRSSNQDAKGPANKLLLSLPLEDRIKKVLCEGPPVHRFNALTYIAPDFTKEEIMKVLQRHALLVQGLWAPKSSLLFPEPNKDGALRISRDYVLHSFWKSPLISVSSLHFPSALKTNVNSFLKIFSVERPTIKDWKFKEPTDNAFMKEYPDIVKNQEMIWESLWNHIRNNFGEAKSGRGAKNVTFSGRPPKPVIAEKPATKGVAEVVSGKNIPDDIRDVLSSKVLPKVIQEHKVCSFKLICQGLRDLALSKLNTPKADPRFVKAAAYGTDAPDELRRLMDQVAINIHGLFVLKSSPEHPQYDSFRNIVISLLQQNGPNAKLKKAEIYEAAKQALNRDATTNEYSKVMNEICAYKGSYWMLKSGDGNKK